MNASTPISGIEPIPVLVIGAKTRTCNIGAGAVTLIPVVYVCNSVFFMCNGLIKYLVLVSPSIKNASIGASLHSSMYI